MSKRRNFFKRATVRSYDGRRFKNPLFKKKKRALWKILVPLFLVAISILAGLGYLIYGPVFTIRNIEINGLTTIPESDVENYILTNLNAQGLKILPKDNRWFVPEDELSSTLMAEFDLSKAETKIEGNTLVLQVEERILEFVWRVDRTFYFIDLDGNITRELRANERNTILQRLNMELDADGSEAEFAPLQPTMPIIEDKSQSEIKVGDDILTHEVTENILAFDLGLRQLMITPLIYEMDSLIDPWFSVVIDRPYKILFDGAGDSTESLKALGVTLNEFTGEITTYIDVRFDNRAYVK